MCVCVCVRARVRVCLSLGGGGIFQNGLRLRASLTLLRSSSRLHVQESLRASAVKFEVYAVSHASCERFAAKVGKTPAHNSKLLKNWGKDINPCNTNSITKYTEI